MTITVNNQPFKVKIKYRTTNDNYNLFVSVFKQGEKLPIIGTVFKKFTPMEDVKQWIKLNIN